MQLLLHKQQFRNVYFTQRGSPHGHHLVRRFAKVRRRIGIDNLFALCGAVLAPAI
jgi:hypothetical protein